MMKRYFLPSRRVENNIGQFRVDIIEYKNGKQHRTIPSRYHGIQKEKKTIQKKIARYNRVKQGIQHPGLYDPAIASTTTSAGLNG